jgi:hypothetical protein
MFYLLELFFFIIVLDEEIKSCRKNVMMELFFCYLETVETSSFWVLNVRTKLISHVKNSFSVPEEKSEQQIWFEL